jgi:Coenzyme PQQ synthesis protein D (PqqD)
MKNPQFPIARKTGIVIQEVPEEVLVYDLDTNKAHCLNQTAALVWKACDGSRSIPDIAKHVESLAGGNISDDFVWLAIDQLSENNLLEQEMNAKFSGITRRDVIKRIGLSTMIAIPIIASLAAPPSALANVSCICNQSSECGVGTPNVNCPQPTCNGLGLCNL